ncbi:MAG: hypothetical protein CL577_07415 [Alteromonadaceae bacterium]|nr:hypothetical protein [Alteromonadaceae bacterium]
MAISAVLPLKACGSYDVNDLKRAHILFTSLSTFMAPGLISELFIVVPEQEVELVKQEYARWQALNIIVLSEDELLPEFKRYPKMRGWRKQQLVKIAIADKVANEFYLTLDADVVCLKPLTEQQLIVDGKALLQYEQRAQHPKWWRSSARLLGISADIGPKGVGMTVTPALMSRTISQQLMQQLTPKAANQNWVDGLCSLHNPSDPRNWWIGRYLKLKWTEYSLYYLCALKLDMLHKFHVIAGTETVPQLLLIHDSHPYEHWQVADSFAPENPGLFCVVGSKTRLPPKQVFERLAPFIQHQPDPSLALLFEPVQ